MPLPFTLWAEIQQIAKYSKIFQQIPTNSKIFQQIPKKSTKMTILLTISDFYISKYSLKNQVVYGKMQKEGGEIRGKFQIYHS